MRARALMSRRRLALVAVVAAVALGALLLVFTQPRGAPTALRPSPASSPTTQTSTPEPAATGRAPTPPLQPSSSPPPGTPSAPGSPATPVAYLLGVELQSEDPIPGGQLAWLRNNSASVLQLGCWLLRSASGKTMYIPVGLRLPAGTSAQLTPDSAWLASVDSVSLMDGSGRLVDQTPQLTDNAHDDQIWYRAASGAWTFGRPPHWEGAINGRMVRQKPSGC